jgi:hypothetical protein
MGAILSVVAILMIARDQTQRRQIQKATELLRTERDQIAYLDAENARLSNFYAMNGAEPPQPADPASQSWLHSTPVARASGAER